MEENKEVKPFGRPTKYTDDMPELLLEFFDVELDREVVKEVPGKEGSFNIIETKPNRLPTVEGFCRHHKIAKSTFHEWRKKHTQFSNALGIAKQMQMNHLMQHALEGTYNAGFAKFLAVNISDYKDKVESKVESKGSISLSYKKAPTS